MQTKISGLLVLVQVWSSLLEQSWGNEENFIPADNTCSCPSDILTYTCTVVGGTATVWSGSVFDCTGNEIVLIHNQFASQSGESGECNDGAIMGRSVRFNGSCYTSQLAIILSTEMNGTSLQCQGTDNIIGSDTLSVISAPLPPPTGISLVNIDQDTLTFNWNSVISNCPINYRTLFECGTCDSSTQATTVTCSGLQLSTDERNCTFNVQTVVCNNIAGNQNSLIVTLKVPDVPSVDVLPVYSNHSQILSSLNITINRVATFSITAGKSGSVKAYNVSYSFDDKIFQTFINSSDDTFMVEVPSSNCPTQGSINVSITAVNLLGEGPPSDPVVIGCSNLFVRVVYNSDTSTLMCIFLNELDISPKSCSITYGQCDTEMKQSTRIEDSNGTILTLTLQELAPPTCFIVMASNSTFSVSVDGSIKGSNVRDSTDTVAVVVPVVIILLIIAGIMVVILGIVVLRLMRRFKSIPYQRASRNMSPPQTLVEIKSLEHKQTSETSNTATVTIENKQTSEREVELESQEQNETEQTSATITTTPVDLKSQENEHISSIIPVEQTKKSGRTALFDTLKWRLNLKEISGRTFKEVKVKENCKLQDCIGGFKFKRGRIYYEFYHEVESVTEDQELIFMRVNGNLYFSDVKSQVLYEEGLLGEELIRPHSGDYRVFIQYWGSGARYLSSHSSLLFEVLEEDPLDGVEYLPLFGIISDHFIVAIPEEDISLGDFRKKNYINGDVLVDISTFLRRGGGHIIDVILRSKVSGNLITGPSARHVVQKYCQHNLEIASKLYKSKDRGSQDNQSSSQISETSPDDYYSEIDRKILEWDSGWTIYVLAKLDENIVLTQKKPILYQNRQNETFYLLEVDEDNVQMREYVTKKLKISFENGKAYYQLTPGCNQDLLYFKNVVCVKDKECGKEFVIETKFENFYELPGAPGERIHLKEQGKEVFVQSCSHGSRCLKKGDKLLYKMDDIAEAHR